MNKLDGGGMDIKEKQARWALEKPLFEAEFIHSHLLPFFTFNENTGDYEIKSECVNNTDDEDRKVAYEALNTGWVMWLRAKRDAKAQAVPEGFVEKTESNTHHYFKLKDWNEWSCIDVIKDAITSDYDINSIVEVEQLEVVEIQQSTKYGLLRFAKRHGDEVVFFDSLEEAQQAQEPAND